MASTSNLPFHTIYAPSGSHPPSATTTSFTLSPDPSGPTDIWRKPGPPAVKTFNAPIIYKSISLRSFHRARVTISGSWSKLYDQGGLVFVLPTPGVAPVDFKWVKTGIEFYHEEPYVSTVAADAAADWSLVKEGVHDGKATIELIRDAKDDTLWIYIIDGEKKIPIREVTWALSEPGSGECWVGVYAATPNPVETGKSLEVKFEGWELETLE
jgi:regulation of enolase protein 1 (concanavalin A-like superfamily)